MCCGRKGEPMKHKLNSYLGMAENDYLYAKAGLEICKSLGNYNAVASGCAQACEKYLKALAELCLLDHPDAISILRSHNLRTIVNAIKEKVPGISLNSKDCKWIGDYYFEARYPGDNFVQVSEEDGLECIRITEDIREVISDAIEEVERKRREQNIF